MLIVYVRCCHNRPYTVLKQKHARLQPVNITQLHEFIKSGKLIKWIKRHDVHCINIFS